MAETYLHQATPVGYKQIGFACGAYSLSLVHQLIDGVNLERQPPAEWHAKAVGEAYSKYMLSDKKEPPKPLPGGFYERVKYTDDDAPHDDTSKAVFVNHLLRPGYSNPAKMVTVFQEKCANGWQAKLCYTSAYDHTSLFFVDSFLKQQLAILGSTPESVDIVTSIKEADAGKSYASVVLISFTGEGPPEIAGLHFVTLRKTEENKLQIYDSNDDTFVWLDQLKGMYDVSSGPKVDRLKVGDACQSGKIPYYYTGFGILYSKS
jgi:hypothetical protein